MVTGSAVELGRSAAELGPGSLRSLHGLDQGVEIADVVQVLPAQQPDGHELPGLHQTGDRPRARAEVRARIPLVEQTRPKCSQSGRADPHGERLRRPCTGPPDHRSVNLDWLRNWTSSRTAWSLREPPG